MQDPKVSSGFRVWALLALALLVSGSHVRAQNFLRLGVSNSPSTVAIVSNALTYTFFVTNFSSAARQVYVTNTFSAMVELKQVSPTNFFTNSSGITFDLGIVGMNSVAGGVLVVNPLVNGLLTNRVTAAAVGLAERPSTNVVNWVTNLTSTIADLRVSFDIPPPVYPNDYVVYGLSVFSFGPNTATNIFLTNTLPSTVIYRGMVSPPGVSPTIKNNDLIFNLGTVTNFTSRDFKIRVQPVASGALPLIARVATNTYTEALPGDNWVSNNLVVVSFPTNALVATTNLPPKLNVQNGLIEQTILLSNASPAAVESARVVVTGVGVNPPLVNAVGTNDGKPFVIYGARLEAGASVGMLLQFFERSHQTFPVTNANLHAVAVDAIDLSPPADLGTAIYITRFYHRKTGEWLLEFSADTNRTYWVVYDDDGSFANAKLVPVPISEPANITQWIDYGPPATVSHPSNAVSRFYKVYRNP